MLLIVSYCSERVEFCGHSCFPNATFQYTHKIYSFSCIPFSQMLIKISHTLLLLLTVSYCSEGVKYCSHSYSCHVTPSRSGVRRRDSVECSSGVAVVTCTDNPALDYLSYRPPQARHRNNETVSVYAQVNQCNIAWFYQ